MGDEWNTLNENIPCMEVQIETIPDRTHLLGEHPNQEDGNGENNLHHIV